MNDRLGRLTAAALLIGLLISTLGMMTVASASNSERGGATKAGLSTVEKAALHEALNEEYLARDTYEYVLVKLGAGVTPFSRIALSEQQHVDALKTLFVKYNLGVPEPALGPTPSFDNRQEACQIGVDAEKHDIALYDDLLGSGEIAHADLVQVFTNLRAASVNNHLPAFDNCN
jgi:hypothetical protein